MQTTTDMSGTGQKDDLFGVCAAIGTDLGFNPDWLRVALAAGLLFSPKIVLASYAAMAVLVVANRLMFPPRRHRPAATVVAMPSRAAAQDPVEMPEAA